MLRSDCFLLIEMKKSNIYYIFPFVYFSLKIR